MKIIKIIDLFAGMGGMRLGFEKAFNEMGFNVECVLTSEIKKSAITTLNKNFKHNQIVGDITKINSSDIPDFDFLLGGFPCQSFSLAGNRRGFLDTRGTLFFEIERILRDKKPYGFILENVDGLVIHDRENKKDKIGRTLKTILDILQNDLQYKVSWKVFNSKEFGLAQERKRIFIVGTKDKKIDLDNHIIKKQKLNEVLESGLPTNNSKFVNALLKNYTLRELHGKSISDRRGGGNNIHSWDIEIKGEISKKQKEILNKLFKERRRKKYAKEIGIDWMDGMALTLNQIHSFCSDIEISELDALLNDLVDKGYILYEHPKKLIKIEKNGKFISQREYDETKPKGYNMIAGRLSYEINRILDPNGTTPALIATDANKLTIIDGDGIRGLSIREGLRLFGYPEQYEIPLNRNKAFDLLGNSVPIPIVEFISSRIVKTIK